MQHGVSVGGARRVTRVGRRVFWMLLEGELLKNGVCFFYGANPGIDNINSIFPALPDKIVLTQGGIAAHGGVYRGTACPPIRL